jgi:cysteine desulfurase/selenocysteine lyase
VIPALATDPGLAPLAVPPAPIAVDPPTGSYPGGGASVGSSPSLATIPTSADLPSSLADAPAGPAAVGPLGGGVVIPGAGPTPSVARPSLGQSFYFLNDAPRGAFGVPGETDLRADLPGVDLPGFELPDAATAAPRSHQGIEALPEAGSWYVLAEPRGIEAWPEPHPSGLVDASPIFDVHAIRRDFPILSERVNGKQLVWLDNAATTQKPRAVIERLSYFYEHENSNIHRAAHELAARATNAYEGARDTVARFLGADSSEIVFVRGTTEAINLVASTWGKQHLGEGDEIVISHLEHHANIVPWQLLAKEKGFTIKVIPVDEDGQLLLDEYTKLLNDRTKLVSLTYVSNALGTITPVREVIEIAHRWGATVLVDGAQSVAHLPSDVRALDADFFVFSGHKIYGPTGIGVLYGKSELLQDLPPYQGGGNMIADVTMERSVFQPPPGRFEAGTGNIADAVGLGAALDYLSGLGLPNVERYEHELLEYATPRMLQVPGLRLIGTAAQKASVLSFVLAGYQPAEVGEALSKEGIAVRSGHHCAQPILRRFGLEATVRPSLALYNTCDEIDQLVAVLAGLAAARPASRP